MEQDKCKVYAKFNIIEVSAIALVLLACIYLFISDDSLDKYEITDCVINLGGLMICAFLAFAIMVIGSYTNRYKGLMAHIAMLSIMHLVQFLRRIYAGDDFCEYVTNLGSLLMTLVCIVSFYYFIWMRINDECNLKKYDTAVNVIAVLGAVFVLSNVIFGQIYYVDDGRYTKGDLYAAAWIAPLLINIVVLISTLRSKMKRKYKLALFSSTVTPLALSVITVLGFPISLTEVAFIVNIIIVFETFYVFKEDEVTRKDIELSISKVNPHFVYNALGAIINLVDDPVKTRDALFNFSVYLRGNIDLVGSQTPIPLKSEIDIISAYVDLQHLRFKDKFDVKYDIQTYDVLIPALTLEILVENSIKHGILPLDRKGTIWISAKKNAYSTEIIVKDDGIGFDPAAPNPDTSRKHIGVENVRSRLEYMVNGKLIIESAVGAGTSCIIILPNRK